MRNCTIQATSATLRSPVSMSDSSANERWLKRVRTPGSSVRKPNSALKTRCTFDLTHGLHPKGQFGAQAWLFLAYVLAKALHDGYFIGFDGVKHGQEQDRAKKHEPPNDHDASGQIGYRPIWCASLPQKTIVPSHSVPLFSPRLTILLSQQYNAITYDAPRLYVFSWKPQRTCRNCQVRHKPVSCRGWELHGDTS